MLELSADEDATASGWQLPWQLPPLTAMAAMGTTGSMIDLPVPESPETAAAPRLTAAPPRLMPWWQSQKEEAEAYEELRGKRFRRFKAAEFGFAGVSLREDDSLPWTTTFKGKLVGHFGKLLDALMAYEEKRDNESNPAADEQDVSCRVCGRYEWIDGNEMLLCDGMSCEYAVHLACHDPVLQEVPDGHFFCSACRAMDSGDQPSTSSSRRPSNGAPPQNSTESHEATGASHSDAVTVSLRSELRDETLRADREQQRADAEAQTAAALRSELDSVRSKLRDETLRADREQQRACAAAVTAASLRADETLRADREQQRANAEAAAAAALRTELDVVRSKLRDETLRADREQQQRTHEAAAAAVSFRPLSAGQANVPPASDDLAAPTLRQLEAVASPPAAALTEPTSQRDEAAVAQPKVYQRGTLLYGVVRGQNLNAHPAKQWPDDREVVAVKSFDTVYGNYTLLAEDDADLQGVAIVELTSSKNTVERNTRRTTEDEVQQERWCGLDLLRRLHTVAMESHSPYRSTPNLGPRKRMRR